jgi:hypothetical protein
VEDAGALASSSRSPLRGRLLRCISRCAQLCHFAVSFPLETLLSWIVPTLRPPPPPSSSLSSPPHPRGNQLSVGPRGDEQSRVLSDDSLRLVQCHQHWSSSHKPRRERATAGWIALARRHRLKPQTPLWRALAVLVTCMGLIAALTSLIVVVSTGIVSELHLDSSTVGATLVALGSEVLHLHLRRLGQLYLPPPYRSPTASTPLLLLGQGFTTEL